MTLAEVELEPAATSQAADVRAIADGPAIRAIRQSERERENRCMRRDGDSVDGTRVSRFFSCKQVALARAKLPLDQSGCAQREREREMGKLFVE